MVKKTLSILILNTFILFQLIGQDVVFTRFNSNPLNTSGALTGSFNGKYRVGTSIRRQWISLSKGSLYSTKTVFADMKFNVVKNDYFSVGLLLLDDISGSRSIKLGVASGLLSMSYSKHLYSNKYSSQNQYLVFGIQAGYGKRYFDTGNYLFGIQFNKNSQKVDPDILPGEPLLNSRLYPDINMGLMYYITGKNNSFYVGGDIKHLNKPNISLLENGLSKIYMLYTGIIGGGFFINRNISLLPSAMINLQGPFSLLTLGTSLRYKYRSAENNAFRVGIWAKLANSINGIILGDIAFSTGFEFKKFEIGLSYDITVSKLANTVGNRGAFELSVAYIWGDTPKNTPINCPRF